jgi:hypothetical protein
LRLHGKGTSLGPYGSRSEASMGDCDEWTDF